MKAGYYDNFPMADYLSDPCVEPSMSTSVIDTLVHRTPLHAHNEHPRFGRRGGESSKRGDEGSAVHALALGHASVAFAPEEFTDWRKKEAQTFRDGAREAGIIPLLQKQQVPIERAAEAAKKALATLGVGRSEVTMIFQLDGGNGPVWCRSRADWLDDADKYDVDLKTCDDAEPSEWLRKRDRVLDIQAALRRMGHEVITGKPRDMRWLLQEMEMPYACSFASPHAALELACKQVLHAARVWRECLNKDQWPGYPLDRVALADVDEWREMAFAMRTGVTP